MNMFDAHLDVQAVWMDELTGEEERHARDHLAACQACRDELASLRALEGSLRSLPPEALLEGPPPDADLLLQRTLRQSRTLGAPQARAGRRRVATFAAAAALVALVAGVSGTVGYTMNAPQASTPVPSAPPAATAPATEVPGTRYASTVDAATGTRLTVSVQPAAGFVKVNAAVTGIPAGERCRLIVEGIDGNREIAGSWVISEKGAAEGATINGSAIFDPSKVRAVMIENSDGKRFAAATL